MLWLLCVCGVSFQAIAQNPPANKLPPLEKMPNSGVNPAQLQHAAEWADTFGGSGTNLEQRLRHNEQIKAYVIAQAQAVAAEYQKLTGEKVELELGNLPKLKKQTKELQLAVAAIREKQRRERMEALAKSAEPFPEVTADDANAAFAAQQAAQRQQGALDEIRQKQEELARQLRQLRR